MSKYPLLMLLLLLLLSLVGCGNLLSMQYTTESSSTPPTLAQKVRGIWMVGGISGATVSTTVDQIDLYDPATNTWYPSVTSFSAGGMSAVSFHGAVGYTRPLDGHHLIVVIGGFDSSENSSNAVSIYDVEADSWSSGTSMSAARANIFATLLNDKVYILGGCSTSASANWGGNTTTWEYTIGSTWNTKVAFGASGTERFSYSYGSVIYNLTGRTSATAFPTTHDGISIANNALTSGTTEVTIPLGRTGVAGVVWTNSSGVPYVILIGGYTALTGNAHNFPANVTTSTCLNSAIVLAYPFAAPSTWATISFPQTIGYGAAAAYGSYVYHFGGTTTMLNNGGSGDSSVRYADMEGLPGAVTWDSASSMPVGRYGHRVVRFQQ